MWHTISACCIAFIGIELATVASAELAACPGDEEGKCGAGLSLLTLKRENPSVAVARSDSEPAPSSPSPAHSANFPAQKDRAENPVVLPSCVLDFQWLNKQTGLGDALFKLQKMLHLARGFGCMLRVPKPLKMLGPEHFQRHGSNGSIDAAMFGEIRWDRYIFVPPDMFSAPRWPHWFNKSLPSVSGSVVLMNERPSLDQMLQVSRTLPGQVSIMTLVFDDPDDDFYDESNGLGSLIDTLLRNSTRDASFEYFGRSREIQDQVTEIIASFPTGDLVGLHVRRGDRLCAKREDCKVLTYKPTCEPTVENVMRAVAITMQSCNARSVFIATDERDSEYRKALRSRLLEHFDTVKYEFDYQHLMDWDDNYFIFSVDEGVMETVNPQCKIQYRVQNDDLMSQLC